MSEPISAEEVARQTSAVLDRRDRAARYLALEVEVCRPGYARLGFDVTEEMVNGLDVCHGGLIFSLADTAMAHASNSRNQLAIASQANIEFIGPGRRGDRLTAEATEQSLQGKNGIYDVRVVNQDGTLIALFRGKTRIVRGEHVEGLRSGPAQGGEG